MKPKVSLHKALEDPELLGSALAGPMAPLAGDPTGSDGRASHQGRAQDLHQVHRPYQGTHATC